MRNVTGSTRVVALLGHPVEHSLSPLMHNRAFAEMGLDICYVAFSVRPGNLADAIKGARALNVLGLNITVPHKQACMPLLDKIHSEAAFMGAVNTVVNENGKFTGYNTDGRGFMKSLERRDIDVEGKRVVIIGSGGGARAISWYLAQEASELCIYNRRPESAMRLVEDLQINYKNVTLMETPDCVRDADVIVNATPLGLKDGDPLPFDTELLDSAKVVCDLIYRETRLIKAASSKGCRTIDGRGMLLWQGVLASELWTGQLPPVDVMREELLKGLSAKP